MTSPIDAQLLADHLRLPFPDQVMVDCLDAATSWVQNVRRCLTDPAVLWADPAVVKGTILYAGLVYQKKAAPQGMPGYDIDVATLDMAGAMSDIYRLVGLDPVVA